MPISYTNIITLKVLNPIRLLLRNEFENSYPVYISNEYEKKGNQSIRLECIRQDSNVLGAGGYENQYIIEISLYLNVSNYETKKVMDKLYNDTARLEQILFNKSDPVNRSNDQAFYGGRVNNITFNEKTDDEAEVDGLLCAKIEYLCFYTKMS
tara:strand:- start:2425 stop:2883 length:459 start_codon:yes stop_codon:yes gene_type:complete